MSQVRTADPFLSAFPIEGVFLILLIVFLPQYEAAGQSQGYQIEGNLRYTIRENELLARRFQLAVSNCDWAITVDAEDVAGVKYYQIVHHANSIFYYTAFDKQPNTANFVNAGGAVIVRGDVPLEDGSFANYIWLGLASACLFGEHSPATNAVIPAIWHVDRDSSGTVNAVFELLDRPPFLPNKVVYYQNPNIMPPPFEQGWRAAELRVLSRTNVGGLTFPQEFVVERFKPKPNAASFGDLERQAHISVTIATVRVGRPLDVAPPQTKGVTLVEERRLPSIPNTAGIVYASSNNVLPRVPDQAAVKLHATLSTITLNQVPENANAGRRKRLIVLGFMVLAIGAFLRFAFRTVRKEQQQKG